MQHENGHPRERIDDQSDDQLDQQSDDQLDQQLDDQLDDQLDQQLDRLLDRQFDVQADGQLTDEHRAAIEVEARADPALRRRLDTQRAIDVSLRRVMTPPSDADLAAILAGGLAGGLAGVPAGVPAGAGATHVNGPIGRVGPRRRIAAWAAVAASMVMMLSGGWLLWRAVVAPGPNASSYFALDGFGDVYRSVVDAGFTPDVICRDDEEFAGWFEERLERPLQLTQPADGVTALGLGYARTLSPRSMHVLLRVDGEPVMVFVDRLEADRATIAPAGPTGPPASPGPDLQMTRRIVGDLVLYQIGPPSARPVLDLFFEPESPAPAPAEAEAEAEARTPPEDTSQPPPPHGPETER